MGCRYAHNKINCDCILKKTKSTSRRLLSRKHFLHRLPLSSNTLLSLCLNQLLSSPTPAGTSPPSSRVLLHWWKRRVILTPFSQWDKKVTSTLLYIAGSFTLPVAYLFPLLTSGVCVCVLQMMNKVFGGTVHKKSVREDGVFSIGLDNTCSLFRYCNFL